MPDRRLICLGCVVLAVFVSGCYTPLRVNQATFSPPVTSSQAAGASVTIKRKIAQTQIVSLLLARNPRIRTLRSASKLRRQSHKRVAVVDNPEFRVGRLSPELPDAGAGGLTLQLRWKPPFPSEAKAKQSRAKARSQIFVQQARATITNMIAVAQGLHVKLVANQRQQHTQRQLQALKRSRWSLSQRRSKMGTSTALKVELARLAYAEAQQQLEQLKRERGQFLGELQSALLLPAGSDIQTPSAWLETLPSVPAFASILAQALRRSPVLRQLIAKREAAHASLWLAYRKRVPWFSFVQFSYDFDKEELPNRFFLSLGIDLPIFNFNTGNINADRQTLQHVKKELQSTKRVITQSVRRVHGQLLRLRRAATLQQKLLTTKVKASLQRATKAKGQGGTNLSEVLDIQAYAIRFQRAYTKILVQYHLQHIELHRLASTHHFKL